MTKTASNYGVVLYDLGITKEMIEETKRIFSLTSELQDALCSPIVPKDEKHDLIKKVFPEEMQNFLNVLCDYQSMDQITDIFKAYDEYFDVQNDILRGVIYYVTAPDEKQLNQIKAYISNRYGKNNIELELVEKPELIGGFVIRVKDQEIDWSMRGRLNKLQQKLIRR